MRRLHLSAAVLGCALAMGAPVPGPADDADRNRRNLKQHTDSASLEATYREVHDNYRRVQDRYKPIIDKLLTNKMPDFLGDFMASINGFTSDLSWVADQPAISKMLYPDPSKDPGPNSVPLPASLMAGPGLPSSSMCGQSGICKDVVAWVRNVNENFRQGTEPSPLMQVAMQNQAGHADAGSPQQAAPGI